MLICQQGDSPKHFPFEKPHGRQCLLCAFAAIMRSLCSNCAPCLTIIHSRCMVRVGWPASSGSKRPVLAGQEFAPVAKDFQVNKWVRFTPHYLVWVCPSSYSKSRECKSQCIRQGRYCTPDPDGDLTEGYSGSDIVQVRPPCLPLPPGCPPRPSLRRARRNPTVLAGNNRVTRN